MENDIPPTGGEGHPGAAVIRVNDLYFLHYPHHFSLPRRLMLNLRNRKSCSKADIIVVPSRFVKEDIIKFFGIPSDKIIVDYPECNPIFRRIAPSAEIESMRSRYRLPERYLLQPVATEKLHNIELAIRALPNISPDMKLVILERVETVNKKELLKLGRRHGVEKRVIFLENVPLHDLPALYQGAEIALYLTPYDSFGIPIVEALESLTPVIAATGNSAEEAGGEDSLYVDPDNVPELIQAIHALLSDPAATRMMTQSGKEYARRFHKTENSVSQ